MDEKTLKALAIKSMSAMLVVVLFSIVFTKYNEETIYTNESFDEISTDSNSAEQLKNQEKKIGIEQQVKKIDSNSMEQVVGTSFLKIAKSSDEKLKIEWEDLYMTNQIRIHLIGLKEESITEESLSCEGESKNSFQSSVISYEYDEKTSLYTAVVDIQLDKIYAQKVYEDKENLYITLEEPHDVYDTIIVVDTGHGGNDVGTYTENMEYYEKNINLSIVFYLKELLDKEKNIKVYYTRLSDEKVYLNPRLDLANNLNADMFVSVHCNDSDYADAKGSEVLYSTSNQEDLLLSSKDLANLFLDELMKVDGMETRGTVNGNEIYIVGNSKVPVALIEVGFMSNQEDMSFLKKEENRKKMAESIYNGIIKASKQLENEKKGTNHGK